MFGALFVILLGTIVLPPPGPATGEQLYATHCASCHGARMDGSDQAPTLHGVGRAAVDFWMRTGRMPAPVPWIESGQRDERSGQRLPSDQIVAIETYLAPIAGKPDIPIVIANGDLNRGRALFTANCAQCHGLSGAGGAIGGSNWAPDLHHAPITQVAEAIRTGPGQMPRFSEAQLTQSDLNDVASYVMSFRLEGSALPLRSGGPIPEGALGWVAIIVLIIFVFVYWRSDTPPPGRQDAVRPDAPAKIRR